LTEQGAKRKLDFSWLRRLVSWKTIIVTMAALGGAVALFVVAGGVDISADKPDGWVATHALHFVFKRSESAASRRVTAPDDLTSASRVRLAAQHFDMVCANCHGRPGFGQSVVALSMNPRPQYLPKVVGQFTDAELYMIVEHGVKYSAMPSWATDARGDEVWSMVAFLRQLPKLDAKAYREMTALPAKTEGAPTGPGSGDAGLRPANARRNTEPLDEFLYAAPATGFYDPTIGDTPAATCARCHGADGSGAATGGEAPNLTIQNAQYLHAALDAYTSGARKSGFMQTIAAELSAEQITALSAYYAGLPVQTPSPSPADPALLKRGEAIATQGIRERAIPACANCHESAGSQVVGAPHIAGQSATFLRRQLAAMGHGGRGSAVAWNPMSDVAHALSDKDIAALAAYYSALPPAKGVGGGQHPPQGQGPQIPAAGAFKADMRGAKEIFETTCIKCHINDGRGDLQGDYPNLTIQTTAYAAQSLYSFHTGARLSGKMREVTDSLTLDQMTSLASYLNSLAPRPALAKPDAAAAQRGAAIATHGLADHAVPACLNCHSAKGISALPLIPPLQGQSVGYLLKKLDYFTKPYPVNDNALNPMPAIARQLTDQQRADLAAYFAAAAPLEKPAARP
jgi:cytochrome c553